MRWRGAPGRRIEVESRRTRIDELDLHRRLKAPLLDSNPHIFKSLAKSLEARQSLLRARRCVEAGAATLLHIGAKRELRDGKDGQTAIEKTEIHLPGGILEDPQLRDAVREDIRVLGLVADSHTNESEESVGDLSDDLPIDSHASPRHALEDGDHFDTLAVPAADDFAAPICAFSSST